VSGKFEDSMGNLCVTYEGSANRYVGRGTTIIIMQV